MKKLYIIFFLLLAGSNLYAAGSDLDSLKQRLQLTTIDSLKGGIYQQIAAEYLQYDTIKHSGVKLYYQNEALNYSLLALRNYSYYEDTLGMRTCFDYLAKVYQSQKKYSQAKWFLLQSNKISRSQKDNFNIITSLVKLSGVKMDNKDYKLAMRDLNEALLLSAKNKMPKLEALVQQNYAYLYNRMKDYEKGDIASKKAAELYESIKLEEEAASAVAIIPQDSVQTIKISPVVKKKLLISGKKNYKVNPTKKNRFIVADHNCFVKLPTVQLQEFYNCI